MSIIPTKGSSYQVPYKRSSQILHELAKLSSERLETLKAILEIIDESRRLVHDLLRERRKGGEKLIHVGTVLFLIPDPVTTLASLPILGVGTILRARASICPRDVFENAHEIFRNFSSICTAFVESSKFSFPRI